MFESQLHSTVYVSKSNNLDYLKCFEKDENYCYLKVLKGTVK